MKTQVIFRGFEGLDHLKSFVQETLEHSIGKLDLGSSDEIKVIVGTTHARRLGRPPTFVCESLMKSRNRSFFAKKNDIDFQSSVRKCVKALSKLVINSTRTKRDKGRSTDRHQSAYDFNQLASQVA